MEIWKDIEGYEGYYQASSLGRIRSLDRIVERKQAGDRAVRVCNQHGKILSLMVNKGTRKGVKPRYEIRLSKDGKVTGHQVHRLIALTFLDGAPELEVNHKDGDTLNNRVDNLELVSRLDNIRHAFENNLIKTSFAVVQIDPVTKEVIKEYYSVSQASRSIPISQGSLRFHLEKRNQDIYKGYIWKYK